MREVLLSALDDILFVLLDGTQVHFDGASLLRIQAKRYRRNPAVLLRVEVERASANFSGRGLAVMIPTLPGFNLVVLARSLRPLVEDVETLRLGRAVDRHTDTVPVIPRQVRIRDVAQGILNGSVGTNQPLVGRLRILIGYEDLTFRAERSLTQRRR